MDNYPTEVKEKLNSLIDDIANVSWLYCTDPGHNFIRSRKLDFAHTMRLIIAMGGGTVNEEMMEFFHYDLDRSPTQSAFNQQRSHVKFEAFQELFQGFVNAYPGTKLYDGYQLLACDGSHVVYATNPQNTDDYVKPQKEGDRGYNQLHLNALYDIVNRTFVDAIIQPGVKQNEHLALYDMLEHFEPSNPSHTILTVDRGYESYNLIAQLSEKKICGLLFEQKTLLQTACSLPLMMNDRIPMNLTYVSSAIFPEANLNLYSVTPMFISTSNQAKTFGILNWVTILRFTIWNFEL